jgi:CubicO group peptidase (beta-lactamase class C family)
MLLGGGELDGTRILKPGTVKFFTEPHEIPAGAKTSNRKLFRSYGWDVDTGFSGQRGEVFPRGEGYGHTGFTGTSIWIDPKSRTAVIILANRVHPDDKGNATRLRREVATAVAEALKP